MVFLVALIRDGEYAFLLQRKGKAAAFRNGALLFTSIVWFDSFVSKCDFDLFDGDGDFTASCGPQAEQGISEAESAACIHLGRYAV